MPISLSELANRIGAELHGDGDHVVIACAPIDTAGADHVAFVANSKYVRFLATTTAGAVIVGPGVECPDTLNRLVSEDPYFAFREAVVALRGLGRG
jgi:UDP-3-O-[3-hydroxymyristoyl] glucosamine N-acyltransferase